MAKKGKLNCDYYVLDYNLEKQKIQFQQVKSMLKSFEYWFGPYPFYEDSYKLVETPHLGMEHQSNVAYGNHYLNGYLGRDLSGNRSWFEDGILSSFTKVDTNGLPTTLPQKRPF